MSKTTFRFNTTQLGIKTRNILQSMPEKTIKTMNEVGGYINGESKKLAPIDEGFLVADISNKTVKYKKSHAAIIYIPSNANSAPYAVKMHENHYFLGKNSQSKQLKVGRIVGRRFIARAYENNIDTIKSIIKNSLMISK